ncbi:MAG: hypothetical protein K9H61_02305 [Bacteroidia bacterium]|nr:hypothetical protein [Bacteroidia bacterium]MCF8445803.1 hypothetical protein [Bacteroidia bacterium]
MSKVIGVSIKDAALNNANVMAKLEPGSASRLRANPMGFRAIVAILSYAICIIGGVGAGATTPLFDTQQAKKVGISDFEQGMKVTNDCIVVGLRLGYASVAPGDAVVGNKAYTNLLYSRTVLAPGGVDMDAGGAGVQSAAVPARTIPATLLNCKLLLKVNGNLRLTVAVNDLFIENDRKDWQNADLNDFLSLQEQLIVVPAGGSVTMELQTADGVAVAGDVNHFFKWSLLVSQLDQVS